jgi:hypothetical protein
MFATNFRGRAGFGVAGDVGLLTAFAVGRMSEVEEVDIMNERQPTKSDRRPKAPIVDPAHAPGKRHLSRGAAAAGTRAVDQHQQQRMPRTTASVHNRRAERGRS